MGKLKERVCKKCGGSYMPSSHNQIFCSSPCRTFEKKYECNLSTGSRGAIAEMAVSADLLSFGYHVFRSISPNAFCDLVAVKDGLVRMVEVRTGWFNGNGSLAYPKKHHKYATEFAVYLHETKRIVYVPILEDGHERGS